MRKTWAYSQQGASGVDYTDHQDLGDVRIGREHFIVLSARNAIKKFKARRPYIIL